MSGAAPITAGVLEGCSGVRHGFFTRAGGVSEGVFATLNAGHGSGDETEKVARNRAIAMDRLGLGPEALATAYQVHGVGVAVVDRPWRRGAAPRADGLVTRRAGVALGVLTADCVPLLLADAEAGVVGAAHAGWRGTKAGVIEAVVEAMCRLGAEAQNIAAALGPSIAQGSYEVGPEFPELILGEAWSPERTRGANPGDHDLFRPAPRAGHLLFDLAGHVARLARAAGIDAVEPVPADTFLDEDRFFSYRRAYLRGEHRYGRCLSAIALEG
jgi:hypothetical protein